MCKKYRRWILWTATAFWLCAAGATEEALRVDGDAALRWHVMQLPILSLAVMATILTVLGKVIAPVRQSYQLGYDAGMRDGVRAALDVRPSSTVVQLDGRPSRRRADLPTG